MNIKPNETNPKIPFGPARLIKRLIGWLVAWEIMPYKSAKWLSDTLGLRHV